MGLVADLEHVLLVDKPETGPCRLEVVDCLAHVALGGKDERGEAFFAVFDLLHLANLEETLENLLVTDLAVAEDGATTLDGLNDLVGLVAGKGEAGCARVDLHGAAECLLGSWCHAVGLVQDHNLVPARRERDLLLGKVLDLIPDDIDTALVRGVELEHSLLVRVAEEGMCEAVDTCRLADTGQTLEQERVSKLGNTSRRGGYRLDAITNHVPR